MQVTVALLESGIDELLIANGLEVLKHYSKQGYLIISEVFDMGIDNSPTLVKKTSFRSGKTVLKTANFRKNSARAKATALY